MPWYNNTNNIVYCSSSKVAPSITKQQSTTPSSRQASSCDGCSLIDVSPPSSAAAAGQWSRKDDLFKLRAPTHPFAVNDDEDDLELIRT